MARYILNFVVENPEDFEEVHDAWSIIQSKVEGSICAVRWWCDRSRSASTGSNPCMNGEMRDIGEPEIRVRGEMLGK
jgi:hypothetical protein